MTKYCHSTCYKYYSSLPCLSQLPEKTEPALADKEIIMAALNIKSMNFGANFLTGGGQGEAETEQVS